MIAATLLVSGLLLCLIGNAAAVASGVFAERENTSGFKLSVFISSTSFATGALLLVAGGSQI